VVFKQDLKEAVEEVERRSGSREFQAEEANRKRLLVLKTNGQMMSVVSG